jgi:hypothetical protein
MKPGLLIRYLDPNIARDASGFAAIITLSAILLIVGIVCVLLPFADCEHADLLRKDINGFIQHDCWFSDRRSGAERKVLGSTKSKTRNDGVDKPEVSNKV